MLRTAIHVAIKMLFIIITEVIAEFITGCVTPVKIFHNDVHSCTNSVKFWTLNYEFDIGSHHDMAS